MPAFLDVTNPVTGALIGRVPTADRAEVEAAVARARAARPAWEALGTRARARLLRRWADLLWAEREAAIRVICAETGKTWVGAYNELFVTDNISLYYSGHAPRLLRPQTRRALFPVFQHARVYYRPHGVVGLITPWNYPFLLAFCDLVPALIAGNTVILKPSEWTPFSAHHGVEWMHRVGVPADVIQVVDGAAETGAALVDTADCIAFTGSSAVGRQVALRAAARLIPYSLELGGKDPLLVLADADLDQAAAGVLIGALENAGQACTSTERVYVDAAVYAAFVERLRQRVPDLMLGTAEGHHVGSLTSARELARVEAQIADAVSRGAQVIAGGQRRPDLGPLFFEPTVLVNVDHTMQVMREETFGPVMAVMRVRDSAEAVRLANDSAYGLSGTIYTRDLRQGAALARQIDSGDVSVNRPLAIWGAAAAPMGGQKSSGSGRRNGPEGLLRFVTSQTVVVDRIPRALVPPGLTHLTPRVRSWIALRRWWLRFLPFLRP
ncbi:MAG: aldehyde dehydrogenase family protein [Anaerolineae bacterium]|nr:aldehyde dehydrogenase family protein [Anaerolineae bacterium]